jgi:hypothetical protein
MILSYSGVTIDCSVAPIEGCLTALYNAYRANTPSLAWDFAQEAITAIAYHGVDFATELGEILNKDDNGLPNSEAGIIYVTNMVNQKSKWQK